MANMTNARPCPACGGDDRFYPIAHSRVMNGPAWHCRQCKHWERSDGAELPRQLQPPTPEEQEQAREAYGAAVAYCESLLWGEQGAAARAYLHKRGFTEDTIKAARLGYHPQTRNSEGLGDYLYSEDRRALDGAKIGGLLGTQAQAKNLLRHAITLPYFDGGTCTLIRGRKLDRNSRAKYLSPGGVPLYAGATPRFYLHNVLQEIRKDNRNKEKAVILTEGEFKALAAWQAWKNNELSMPAVATPGGGYLPDALLDALAGLTVYLVYDSEARDERTPFALTPGERFTLQNGEKLTGAKIGAQLQHTRAALKRATRGRYANEEEAEQLRETVATLEKQLDAAKARRIRVKVVRLPREADQQKIDLDDYLLQHGPAALQRLLDHAADFPLWYAGHNGGGYEYRAGGMFKGGEQLANYQARIVEDVLKHDGIEETGYHRFALRTPSGTLRTADIEASKWADPRKGLEALRLALLEGAADDEGKEALRAVKYLSRYGDDPAKRVIFTATGWEQIGGRWHYLMPDGAITANGVSAQTRAEVPQQAQGNHYAMCGEGSAARGAGAFLDLLRGKACPQSMALILASHAALAPLHRFTGHSDRALPWQYGESGVHKTSLLRVFASLYGPGFTAERADGAPLPKWDSTYTALELLAFTYRDVLFAIDDYKPATAQRDALARFLHAYSESSSRSRGRRDRTLDRTFPARGMAICTGEDRPTGDTGQMARILPIEVRRGDIDTEALAEAQAAGARGDLAAFWRGFIQDIALHLDKLGEDRLQGLLQDMMKQDEARLPGHKRAVGALRQNRMAWLILLDYLQRAGYVTAQEAAELDAAHLEARHIVAQAQAQATEEERPGDIFLSVLSELLTTGEAVLEGTPFDGEFPSADLEAKHRSEQIVGFYYEGSDGLQGIALYPHAPFRAVHKALRESGSALNYSKSAIRDQLNNAKHILPASNGDTTRPLRHPVTKAVKRVTLLDPAALFPQEESRAEELVTDVTAGNEAPVTKRYNGFSTSEGVENGLVTDVTVVTGKSIDTHNGNVNSPLSSPNGVINSKHNPMHENPVTTVTNCYKAESSTKNVVTEGVTSNGENVTPVTKYNPAEVTDANNRALALEHARAQEWQKARRWAGMILDGHTKGLTLREITALQREAERGVAAD